MITLRPAAADDEEFLYQLYASTRADELATWQWDAAQAETFLRMQHRAQDHSYRQQHPAATTQIICADEAAIGRLVAERSAEAILLIDLALLPEWRGRGIGTALIRGAQAEAAAAGQPVRLHVLTTNPAQRLYRRLGFVLEDEPGVYLAMIWHPLIAPATEPAN